MQGGAGGNDVLISIENLFGSAFNDELYGSESDNVLLGGSGGDLITGRGGIDEANYALALSMAIANLSTHSASVGAGNDVLVLISNLSGSNFADSLQANDSGSVLLGVDGNDTLTGGAGDDALFGGNGNDTLMGHGGGDEIDGEAGVDTVSYRLAAGNVNVNLGNGTVSGAEGSDTLRNTENILGGDFEDMLIGDAGANRIDGGLGRDELVGAAGNDSVFGGEGNDLLTGDAGNDALIGGPGVNALYGDAGFDVANDSGSLAVAASLVDKVARVGADVAYDTLVDIEGIIGSSASDVLSGLNGLANLLGETFRPGGGNDTVSGGTGVDTVEYAGLRSAYVVARDSVTSTTMSVSHKSGGSDGVDALSGIEQLLFQDRLLAFGARAEEVARVAFVLWSPGIATSKDFFAKGLSFYNNGYDFDFLCQIALNDHPETGTALAQKLLAGTPGTAHTLADINAVMAAAGGGSTRPGRMAAVKYMALDPATLVNIELVGMRSNGVEAWLVVDGTVVLFAPMAGG